jgi:hypothetical protein
MPVFISIFHHFWLSVKLFLFLSIRQIIVLFVEEKKDIETVKRINGTWLS